MSYPENDSEYEDKAIEKVEGDNPDCYVITCDGWSLFCGEKCPVVPEAGQSARFYGRGIGAPVRGLFINGEKIWYRTDAEEKEYREIMSYGADAADWLKRWDAGQSVWTISMGGLGPSYEQCIHIAAAEILRWLLDHNSDSSLWEKDDAWKETRDGIERDLFKLPVIEKLGLSGAQWGAALNVATNFYRQGPRAVMKDARVKDRHIQVMKYFPSAA